MLETLRGFAEDQLSFAETRRLRRRHADHFLALAEMASPLVNGNAQIVWLTKLDDEIENLRAVLTWAASSQNTALGMRLAAALRYYWNIRGPGKEGLDWLKLFTQRDDAVSDPSLAVPPLIRATAESAIGLLSWSQGDFADARAAHESAARLYREARDENGLAEALYNLGITAYRQSDLAVAKSYLDASLEIAQRLGDREGIGRVLLNVGNLAQAQGDTAEATRCYEESLVIYREIGNSFREAAALHNLGFIAFEQKKFAEAEYYYEQSLALRRELRDEMRSAVSLNGLGAIARIQGEHAKARALLGEALSRSFEFGDKYILSYVLINLGMLASVTGDHPTSVLLISTARRLYPSSGIASQQEYAAECDRALEIAKAQIDPISYLDSWRRGQTQSLAVTVDAILSGRLIQIP
jgi:tetratricopeptide (TPR) repeat protein